jgi:hypothetical protein
VAKTIREVERKITAREIIEAFFPEEVDTLPIREIIEAFFPEEVDTLPIKDRHITAFVTRSAGMLYVEARWELKD